MEPARRCLHMHDGPVCGLQLAEPQALPSACETCPHYAGDMRGLGDAVHAVAKATGIETVVGTLTGNKCGCKRRRVALNRLMPFGRPKPQR